MQVRKIYSQHGGRIVNIPKSVLRRMEAKTGSYVMFQEIEDTGVFIIAKIKDGDYPHGRNANDPGNTDPRGGPRPKAR